MSIVDFHTKDDVLYLLPKGRIDSANAQAVEAEMIAALESPHKGLVVDAADLQYISSAGLRVVLRLRRKEADMRIVNVSAEVYDIFEMTGFSEMIPIEKAYRRVSVDGCEMIGKGANGKVYRLDADTIIKVYINPDSLPDIVRERELARKAFVLGVPTAISYDIVRVGDSYGSVFELLNSDSLKKLLTKHPENIDEYASIFVDLLKVIHGTEVKPDDMPDMKEVVLGWVDYLRDALPADKYEKLRRLVEAVPVRHTMIHGDYHVGNVMMQNGEALLIDMDTLAQGDPVFEFASVFNAYKGFSALDHSVVMDFLGIPYEVTSAFWDLTLQKYFGTDDKAYLASVEDKASLIGFVRLLRRLLRRGGRDTADGRRHIEFYTNAILERLDRVETLAL